MKWFILTNLIFFSLTVFSGDLTEAEFSKFMQNNKRTKGLALIIGSVEEGVNVLKATDYYVHILASAEVNLQKSRKILEEKNLIQKGTVIRNEHLTRLPYADNLLNLVVIGEIKDLKYNAQEITRVLAPHGLVLMAPDQNVLIKELEAVGLNFSKAGDWVFAEKATPKGFDDWSHIKGDSNQTNTNSDSEVGPWEEIRWIADPKWGSLYVSYTSVVTGNGIMYYQESTTIKGIGQWFLIARDAYNGVELWRENIGGFLKYIRNPDYTYCADEKSLYYREESRQISRDSMTGKKLMTYETKIPPEFALVNGSVLVLCSKSTLDAFDKSSGKLLWSQTISIYPAALNGVLYMVKDDGIKAITLETGKEVWMAKIPGFDIKKDNNLFCKDNNVYLSMKTPYKPDHSIVSFNIKTGEKLWSYDGAWWYGSIPYKDDIWLLDYTNKDHSKSVSMKILKATSGKVDKEFPVVGNAGGHCWGTRGSENYLMYSNGWYYDRNKNEGKMVGTTRSPCRIGQIPANGLTYFMPHHCDCSVILRGFLALGKKGQLDWVENNENRLKTYKTNSPMVESKDNPNNWPYYRKDSLRNNTSAESIEKKLKLSWNKKIGSSKLTQASIYNGLVYVGSKQGSQVYVYNENNGDLVWSFYADGSILSSPSIDGNYCLVGTGSGYVHCLNAKTGEQVWDLRAAPVQKYIGDRDKLDSSWPVQGSILIKNKIAYFSVGRASSQDLGMYLYAVEVPTGKIVWSQNFSGKNALCADMFLADDKKLSTWDTGFDFLTGKIDKGFKLTPPFIKTTRYLSTVSIINYMESIEPQQTDKRHVFLTDGQQLGNILSSTAQVSVAAGRIATSYEGWKEKHGQFFLKAKGEFNWVMDDMDIQIFGLVTSKDKIFAAGVNPQTEKAVLRAYSLAGGKQLQELPFEGKPIYDALSLSNGRLYLTTENGNIYCYLGE